MTAEAIRPKAFGVIAAAAVVVILLGLLGVRLADWARAAGVAKSVSPAAAAVPAPHTVRVETLQVPCWTCSDSKAWPLRFRTDLDLLAPLGTGTANAAVWFKDFTKPSGSRWAEVQAAMARRVDGPGDAGKVLPGDDPLLFEAEPRCDQATMRFYPEFFPMKGFDTPIPNLVLPLTLARSWVARGERASDPARATEDFRRAIRLGRLLRQDDVTIIQDLVGLVCINAGAQGIYDLAVKQGDTKLALVASIVLGEYTAQRLLTAERITTTDLRPYLRRSADGEVTLDVPDAKVGDIAAAASSGPDRRFRLEAILELNLVGFLGTKAQQEKAMASVNELTTSSDPIVADNARWARDFKPTREYLQGALTFLPPPAPTPKKP